MPIALAAVFIRPDDEVLAWSDLGAIGQRPFRDIPGVVGEVPSRQVNGAASVVEQLNPIVRFTRFVRGGGVVFGLDLVDHHFASVRIHDGFDVKEVNVVFGTGRLVAASCGVVVFDGFKVEPQHAAGAHARKRGRIGSEFSTALHQIHGQCIEVPFQCIAPMQD